MSKDTSCACGKTPIQARVELWCDGWAPSGRDCDKARSIFEEQFRTMLGEVFDEIEQRAEAQMADTPYYLEGSKYNDACVAAIAQVRAELCERKP